jgi:hypothetical protein
MRADPQRFVLPCKANATCCALTTERTVNLPVVNRSSAAGFAAFAADARERACAGSGVLTWRPVGPPAIDAGRGRNEDFDTNNDADSDQVFHLS